MKIENNLFEKGALPLFWVSTAILAGSKRFIQYYPGTCFPGLILQSGLVSGTFLAFDYFLEKKSEIHTILALGISTLIIPALYQQLSNHFPTLPKGSTKLGVHQFTASAIGAITYQFLFKTSEPPPPQLPKVPHQFKLSSDHERNRATTKTCKTIQENLSQSPNNAQPGMHPVNYDLLPPWIQEECQKIVLFSHEEATETRTKKVLGRFDIIAVPTVMDLDHDWKPYDSPDSQIPFYTVHGAAINIGESVGAEDFKDYSIGSALDEAKYLQDMSKVFHLMLSAQEKTGTQEGVWFPFGMGAFLRNLPRNDNSYSDSKKLDALRKKIADQFMVQALQFPKMQIHLCLPVNQQDHTSEMTRNYSAFMQAYNENTPTNMKIHENVDASALAQDLANQSGVPYSVSLANGANRNLIGNHWFGYSAKTAIDENIHRRSSWLAVFAFLINGGKKAPSIDKWITDQLHGQHEVLI